MRLWSTEGENEDVWLARYTVHTLENTNPTNRWKGNRARIQESTRQYYEGEDITFGDYSPTCTWILVMDGGRETATILTSIHRIARLRPRLWHTFLHGDHLGGGNRRK